MAVSLIQAQDRDTATMIQRTAHLYSLAPEIQYLAHDVRGMQVGVMLMLAGFDMRHTKGSLSEPINFLLCNQLTKDETEEQETG
jgi:hypothetical protein